MTVEEIRFFVFSVSNRDQTGNSLTPNEYNSYLGRANEELFNLGLRIEDNGTRTFNSAQVSADTYSPFLKEIPLTGIAGVFNFPSDYRHTVSANTTLSRPVTVVTKNQFYQILIDHVNFPTLQYPYATILNGSFFVQPSMTDITFCYLRKPAVPFWNWTVINDEEVYNPVGSVQLEYPDFIHLYFCKILLGYIAPQFRDMELEQISQLMKKDAA